MELQADDLSIPSLGPCRYDSPLSKLLEGFYCENRFVEDDAKVVFDNTVAWIERYRQKGEPLPALELAGPRRKIYFEVEKTNCAIVTCGGLCPGLNDVIRGLVMQLYYRYGVRRILGICYGYQGFIEKYGQEPLELTPEKVRDIHKQGGSFLGSSRGPQDVGEILAFLEKNNIHILFVIGGDGTMRGALEIAEAAAQRNFMLSVIGIPKTIDNDILYLDQSFGFESAFAEAVKAINSAHNEALGAPNGIGLVKVMGRHSGFIACYAALAMNDVNYVLIPEVPFELEGENGLLNILRERLLRRGHAVILVAEGAGQEHLPETSEARDPSGNIRLGDIGLFLKDRINHYFKSLGMEVNLKYIDPGYMIRAIPASPQDSVYCLRLAENAVHAAMAGKTKMVIGRRNNHYVHLPMTLVAQGRKQVDPCGDLWLAVLDATGQPAAFTHQGIKASSRIH